MKQYFSNTAFIDLLFNIVVGIAFLFIIAFLLINPITKKNEIKSKADYFIMLYWDPESLHDIDLWVRDPVKNVVSFKTKEAGLMHLDRDDLGYKNDKIQFPDGAVTIVKNNEEEVALRGTVPGWYEVNVHAYRKTQFYNVEEDDWYDDELEVKVTLIRVNPYKEILRKYITFVLEGEEHTAFRFEVDENGDVIDFDEKRVRMVKTEFTGATPMSGGF